jgi:hypothetical protein
MAQLSADTADLNSGLHHRKNSVQAVELTDDKGRRRTVHLDELSEADRELAEKWGYKPVRCQTRENFLETRY